MKRLAGLVPILLLVGFVSWGIPLGAVEIAVSDQPSSSPRECGGIVPHAVASSDSLDPDHEDELAGVGWTSIERVGTRPVPIPPRGALALDEPRTLPASYDGSGRLSAAWPISLASDHFDGDGVADLVCGHSGPDGHVLTLHRGNIDSIFPHTPEARSRRADGTASGSPFYMSARSFEIPVRPDFLASGDFDNDGNRDVVIASSGGRVLYLLGGDGRGGFLATESLELPGAITALVGGEINRRDGLNDLVVAVDGAGGPLALIFEGPDGALRRKPEIVPLPAPASAMALGRLRGDYARDLALAVGSEVLIVHGRDRHLTASRARRESVGSPTLERLQPGGSVAGLAIGDFLWEETALTELAVLSEDGVVVLFGSDEGSGSAADSQGDDSVPGERPLQRLLEHRLLQRGAFAGDSHAAAPVLLPARASSWPTEDLIVLDAAGRRLHVVSGAERSQASSGGTDTVRTISMALEGPPVAALPMRLNDDALADLVVLQEETGPGVILTSIQATITVDTDADDSLPGDGECSLREALINANTDSDATAGDCLAGAGADAIAFNIAGGGARATIRPLAVLPAIQDSVILNGNTQGCPTPPCILLWGSLTTGQSGLLFAGGSSTLRGLVISRFDGRGVNVESPGNFVEGNYFGLNASGAVAAGNGSDGLSVNFVPDNTIGGTVAAARNVASDAGEGQGLQINGAGAVGNQILGNYAGTDLTGTIDLGNFYEGVVIFAGSDNTIGGLIPGARNVISGNDYSGVLVIDGGHDNLIVGNFIGVDATGTLKLGNEFQGVYLLEAPDNTVGSTAAAGRNIVSGNVGRGFFITPAQSSGNKVVGNFIGPDVTGTIGMGNGETLSAVEIDDATLTQLGGTTPSAGNVISGNAWGVFLDDSTCSHNEILGNFIGTDVSGTLPLGNEHVGIYSTDGAHDNVIGGAGPGAGNVVSANLRGLELSDCTSGQIVKGNHIGVDVTGTAALGNVELGIFIHECVDNTIGGDAPGAGNVISGNHRGLEVANCATGQVVSGNHIGVDATGTAALGNAEVGILIHQCSGNIIGGDAPGAGNVISDNLRGIIIQGPEGPAENNLVLGNLIGTDASGTVAFGNATSGVDIPGADNNQVGGTAPGARNVISANGGAGVRVEEGSNRNQIQGNLIGTDVTGTRALPNLNSGVNLMLDSTSTVVGGTTPGSGNLISGNSPNGITTASGSGRNTFQGNLVGTDISGTTLLGNALKGISIEGGIGSNTIGGTAAGAGNVIAGSGEEGVAIAAGTAANPIQRNSIFANGLLGIDLGIDGVTANDYQDPDSGANLLQNFPELISADADFTSVAIDGSLNSRQNSSFRIEFFASSNCDGSGHGEGERYLGALDVATDAAGDAGFNAILPVGVGDGEAVTAAATTYGLAKNTSEFSACVGAVCQQTLPMAPTIEAPNRSAFVWSPAMDVRFVKGLLAEVDAYSTIGGGWAKGATSLDTSLDDPAPGSGLFYLLRPLGCGSWQTISGAEPGGTRRSRRSEATYYGVPSGFSAGHRSE